MYKAREVRCKNCGKIFISRQKNPKFCSIKCWGQWKSKQVWGRTDLTFKEKKKIWRRRYYLAHKEIENKRNLEWNKSHPEKMKEIARKYWSSWKERFHHIVWKCKKKGIPCEEKAQDYYPWYENTPKKCYYCGITEEELSKLSLKKGKKLQIERIDPTKGYTLDNIVLACYKCNSIKSNIFTAEEMKEIAQKYKIKERLLQNMNTEETEQK
jgi:hypothetical protein